MTGEYATKADIQNAEDTVLRISLATIGFVMFSVGLILILFGVELGGALLAFGSCVPVWMAIGGTDHPIHGGEARDVEGGILQKLWHMIGCIITDFRVSMFALPLMWGIFLGVILRPLVLGFGIGIRSQWKIEKEIETAEDSQ